MKTTRFSLLATAVSLLMNGLPAFANSTIEGLFENVSLCGEGGVSEARASAQAHANSAGENLGYHSIGLEEQTFTSEYTPPEFPEGMQGSYVYGLAIFSDDGCELSIDGRKVNERYRKGQALPRLDQSFYDLPVLLTPGEPVQIELKYSNVYFINRSGYADIDGVTLYLYRVKAGIIPDYNRDGVINDEDRGKVNKANPWRWWINDDDDKDGVSGAWDGSGDMPTGRWGDSHDFRVDGIRDLVDFFPLELEIADVLRKFPAENYRYEIRHLEEAIKFYPLAGVEPTSNMGAARHLRNPALAKSLERERLHLAAESGRELENDFLQAVAANEAMLLCEGFNTSKQPLVLAIENTDGQTVGKLELPLMINRVEEMYRHLNLRDQLAEGHRGTTGGLSTRMSDPGQPYPDELTNDSYFVHVHGFANDAEVARAGMAEIFKRLHQMGSRARFVGVSWHGDTQPNYHRAVHHAFLTGDILATRLPKDGDIIISGHSLGNVVVSQAIEYGGLKVKNYFMINAASPIEAYDSNQSTGADGKDMQGFMTEMSWQNFLPHRRKLFAADWHGLFAAEDGRSKLTWKGRFANKVPKVATNFYSTGEDVVKNPDEVLTVTRHLVNRIKEFNFVEHSWVAQEISKGSDLMEAVILDGTHAGWDFNHTDEEWQDIRKQESWEQHIDDHVTTSFVRQHPFYEPFKYAELYDLAKGSAKAREKNLQYELLATAIPAMSYAVAANPVDAFNGTGKNYNMMNMKTEHQWPRRDKHGDWLHGDFRAVALCYVHGMYSRIINIGKLND